MIIIEIRSDELRGMLVKKRFNSNRITEAASLALEKDTTFDLMNGDTKLLEKSIVSLMNQLGEDLKTRRSITLLINLEDVMSQKLTIPKVKDNEISFSINSSLIKDKVPVTADSIVSYAVKVDEDKDSKDYKILAHILEKDILNNIINVFNRLELKLKTIDIVPNTTIKIFEETTFAKEGHSLNLIVDLAYTGARYYQLVDGEFSLSYLEKAQYNEEDYIDIFEDNVYQFLDEFNEYTVEDINIVLFGEEELVKKIKLNFEGIFNINVFSDGLIEYENFTLIKLDKYINILGTLIRKDKMLSSHSKYDINMLDKEMLSNSRKDAEAIRSLIKIGSLVVVISSMFLFAYGIKNREIASSNEAIVKYIENPQVNVQIEAKENIERELKAYNGLLETLTDIEEHLYITQRPFSSRVYYAITSKLPDGGTIDKVAYKDGIVTIIITSKHEAGFKEYVSKLERETLLDSVKYNGYSLSGDEYKGQIEVRVKGSESK